jgi:hypothetical protein
VELAAAVVSGGGWRGIRGIAWGDGTQIRITPSRDRPRSMRFPGGTQRYRV